MRTTTSRVAVLLLGCLAGMARAKTLTPADVTEVVKTIDDRQRNSGDYRSLAYLEQKEKDKTDTAREAIVYRRSADQKLMILFTKPKGEAGKGYLRLDKNLWSYDPTTGSGTRATTARSRTWSRRRRTRPTRRARPSSTDEARTRS